MGKGDLNGRRAGVKAVDPIRAEVIARFLLATAEEMGATLTRTAFSPNIKERADCSTALCDASGRALSLMTNAPAHLGSTLRLSRPASPTPAR